PGRAAPLPAGPGSAATRTGASPADVPARRPTEPGPADHTGPASHTGAGHAGYSDYGEQPGTRRRDPAERGLRGLVAAGPSQVGVIGAMRARDASRPRPEDLEAAERELTIVRRYYVPPEGSPPTNPAPDPD